MDVTRSQRIGALAGVLFAVVFAVGFTVSGDTPDFDASGAQVIEKYSDEGPIFLGVLGLALCGVLLLFFAGALRARLSGGGLEWVSTVAFGGAIAYSVGLGVFAMGQVALIDAAELGQPEVAQALNILDNNNFFPAIMGLSVLLLATAWHALTTRSLPVWLGWITLILGVVAIAGPLGFVAFLLSPIWVLVVAITLLRTQPVVVPA